MDSLGWRIRVAKENIIGAITRVQEANEGLSAEDKEPLLVQLNIVMTHLRMAQQEIIKLVKGQIMAVERRSGRERRDRRTDNSTET